MHTRRQIVGELRNGEKQDKIENLQIQKVFTIKCMLALSHWRAELNFWTQTA